MAIQLKRMQPGDELDFTEIAPDVFDEPIHPSGSKPTCSSPAT
jgi:hypothetical protein